MNILGMGPAELLLVLALALIVFGPDKLPDIARQLGKVVGEFRRVSSDVTRELQRSIQEEPPASGPRIVRQAPPSGPTPVQPAASPVAAAPVHPGADVAENRILPPTNGEAPAPPTAPPPGSWEEGPAKPVAPQAPEEPRRTL